MKGNWRKILCGALIMSCICVPGCGRQDDAGSGSGAGMNNSQGDLGTKGDAGEGNEAGSSKGENAGNGTGAGNGTAAQSGYMDIRSDVREIFVKEEGQSGFPLGLQYYQGEPIQLWAVSNDEVVMPEEEGGKVEINKKTDVYLYKEDGSSEILVEGLPDMDWVGAWYLAQDGSCYCITENYQEGSSVIIKRNGDGEAVFEQKVDMRVTDICQLSDGRLFVVLNDNGGINAQIRVGELNPDTGAVTEMSQIRTGSGLLYIGADEDKLLVLDTMEEVRKVDPGDGSSTSLMVFSSTSYEKGNLSWGDYGEAEEVRVLDDGSIEILRSMGSECAVETLRMQAIEGNPIVVRGFHFNNGWIKARVAEFNKTNDNYHIVLEEPVEGGDWDDFATQTSIQITTGKGPDILYGAVISDYVQGMIDKGGFEDLKPYMDKTGVQEEDYFPSTFMWRDGEKIYGVNVTLFTYRYSIDASVLEEGQEMNIENLVNALYSSQDKAMYMRFHDAGDILEMFLEGSEDLWGMINWEEGTCDFGGELFARMLDVAKRYAYDENQDYPILGERISCDGLFRFDAPLMQKREGTRTAGVMFDDGCYPAMNYTYQILAINTNSVQKEGAWEFIRFLLDDESQRAIMEDHSTPVQKKAFETYLEKEMESLEHDKTISLGSAYMYRGKYVEVKKEITEKDVTEEWLDAFRQAAEDARPLPIRTMPVLEIILDEAEDYFNGVKSIEEVVSVIENRAQLYIDENSF